MLLVFIRVRKFHGVGFKFRQTVRYEIACVESADLTRYRLQIMVVVLCRLDPHAFEPEVVVVGFY